MVVVTSAQETLQFYHKKDFAISWGLLGIIVLVVGLILYIPASEAEDVSFGTGGEFTCGLILTIIGIVTIPVSFSLLKFGPQVIISNKGLEDRRLRTGIIPWEEIAEAKLFYMSADSYIGLKLHSPERFPPRPRGMQRLFPASGPEAGHVNIYARPLNIDPCELEKLIKTRLANTEAVG